MIKPEMQEKIIAFAERRGEWSGRAVYWVLSSAIFIVVAVFVTGCILATEELLFPFSAGLLGVLAAEKFVPWLLKNSARLLTPPSE